MSGKLLLPESITENDCAASTWLILLGRERSSVQGRDAQNFEEAFGNAPDTKVLGLAIGHEVEAGWFDRGKRLECGTPLSPIQEICWRARETLSGSVGALLPDRYDTIWPRKGKRIQQDCVDDAEHCGRRANPDGQRQDHDAGEGRIPDGHPQAVTRILNELFDDGPGALVSYFFL
jgi:hypothetical protein